MTSQIPRTVLAVIALGALINSAPDQSDRVWAATNTSNGSQSPSGSQSSGSQASSASQSSRSQDAARERTAIGALGKARYAAQNHRPKDVLDQIERAETALLNIAQVARDPHIDTALQHIAVARLEVGRNNLRGAETELAAGTRDLTVALALAAPGDPLLSQAMPMIGQVVYDADSDKVGDVTEIIFAPSGGVAEIVVGVGDFLGTGEKNVAVPARQVIMANDRVTVGFNKDQLRQASNYRLPDYGS
jgi:sporulation protein YlmC with PRC-barrel domain